MLINDNSRSVSGFPDQPADDTHLEPGIRRLVYALNRSGLRTRASCQGHWHWFFGPSIPYVAFTGSEERAYRLSQFLSHLQQRGGLHWDLSARFGTDGLLWFRLAPARPFPLFAETLIPAPFWRRAWTVYLRRVEADQIAIEDHLEAP